ncbi:MAG: tRNA 2-selenouridine(34) synthase MnmH [Cytophagales bacterium]|nr:MAG: tRNA 2-selenouridine(34) synthase MnmH [Cytophagales bacterium]
MIDVRSPAEFAQGHIPLAVNLPIFSNEERAVVGTLYKQKGKEEAIIKGLEFVGVKMADFVRKAKQIAPEKQLLVHCWRGGMRSGSMAWLFETVGFQTFTLEKGYKNYRQHVLSYFEQAFPNLLILGGMTGSGKTDILKQIIAQGQQGIDLEGLAHHKGSSFGSIGQAPQPTSEQFENELHLALLRTISSLTSPFSHLWLEDESRNIGKTFLPNNLWQQMQRSPVIYIQISKNLRIERLVKEYAFCDKELLESAILRIAKRIGSNHAKDALEALANDDFAKVADITLVYYDKAYTHDNQRRKPESIYYLPVEVDNPTETAQKAIELAKTLI